ncbi:hypothetical protein SARC_06565 [Sphaeroforma arctica JP610]|uniref:Uncharacterized protein n=1 Tax=Sphaeroforma arctica JP610 TaxID=667725 RepID=A0A0L0FW89_9EUKA|nr:hypothetical protein SARC_06565 [Sphaeroforma arctica JP610]KNC81085.1 hypothetical protein SARC_06565 [Sphaeroforma arctica JP610]|eukprot:XP_014154987.1 hypothetical protein SARC_06565 [Sphaeroforma arctica JP610]
MSICGLISSSNKFEKREGEEDAISVTITIDTSDPVIWTSEIDLLAIHNS